METDLTTSSPSPPGITMSPSSDKKRSVSRNRRKSRTPSAQHQLLQQKSQSLDPHHLSQNYVNPFITSASRAPSTHSAFYPHPPLRPPQRRSSNMFPPVKIDVLKVGIYGWRKKFLYFLILVIMALVMLNVALILWIFRNLNISFYGMRNFDITSDSVRLKGDSFISGDLYASHIKSTPGSNLKLDSTLNNISIVGKKRDTDDGDDVQDDIRLFLSPKSVDVFAEQFRVGRPDGDLLFFADANRVVVSSDKLWIKNDYGFNFNGSFQTPVIRSTPYEPLRIISPTREVMITAPRGVYLQAMAGDISISSLMDLHFRSRQGKISLDSSRIELKNLPSATPSFITSASSPTVSSSSSSSSIPLSSPGYSQVYQLCICADGKLFMADPESSCSSDDKICSKK